MKQHLHTRFFRKGAKGPDQRTFCCIGRADGDSAELRYLPACPYCAVIRRMWLDTMKKPATVRRFRAWARKHPVVLEIRRQACEHAKINRGGAR